MRIENKALRIHLKKYNLNPEEIDTLDITRADLVFFDEDDTLSVITDSFKENSDLSMFTHLQVLGISGQPLNGEIILSATIQEIVIKECGPLLIRVGDLELKVPSSKEGIWYWKKGA